MSRMLRFVIVFAVMLAALPLAPSQARSSPANPPPPTVECVPGQLGSANFIACKPEPSYWNQDLVVFAHGYVDPAAGPFDWLGQLVLPDGTRLPDIVTSLGYAFAASGYSVNGLAVKEGIADTAALVQAFKAQYPQTKNVFIVGVSEGGLITALSMEKLPDLYAGGVAACGPIGDFRGQINYLGDFRVLYDYFYPYQPGLPPVGLPPTAVSIPDELFNNWTVATTLPFSYALTVAGTVLNPANAATTAQLLKTANAPIDKSDPTSVVATTVGVLDYNVRATENAKSVLGGQPFSNKYRWYSGSANDWKLNKEVKRYEAAPAALAEIARNYQTSGKLTKPLIGLHTTGDQIVPFWHALMYRAKTFTTGSVHKFINIPVLRYGHCNFKANEALAAFALMVYKATGQLPAGGLTALRSLEPQAEFNLPATDPAEEGGYQR